MVIDGLEPDTVQEILEIEIESMQARHMKGIDMFAKMGGYSPTFGVLGTVMGLVSVLANLSDPSGLGESIATAFIATLFGVGAANVLWLPVSSNLKNKDSAEAKESQLALAAILSIQAGDNPRIVAQKLSAHAGPEPQAAAEPETGAPAPSMAEAA
jgi:chemotaxis protein MotA